MLPNPDFRQTLVSVFTQLRDSYDLELGIGELLAAVELMEGDFEIENEQHLQAVICSLWCRSLQEQIAFHTVWHAIVETSTLEESRHSGHSQLPLQPRPEPVEDMSLPPMLMPQQSTPLQTTFLDWTVLPVCAPFMPTATGRKYDLFSYWPISSRSMAYAWRYLRRPLADGPEDVLDIEATVERVARQGFFLSPVYRRRERNHAHLLLLVDQGGSMAPMHRFSRDLIETAQSENSTIEEVDVLYFHNVPGEHVYTDPYLTKAVPRIQVLAHCTTDTSVLIVSDAGAARGHRILPRIQATTEILFHLKQYTSLIAWLNPMPQERWQGSSAQIIATAHLVPMYQMDVDGFNKAIDDVVRGQPRHHLGA